MDPDVSIIILVLDRVELLVRCLDSIAQLPDAPSREVVVLANGTPEARLAPLARRDDIVLVRSSVNLGFAGGCNWVARAGRGRHLVFLNDDTEVESGWLRALVDTADSDPRIGAVGSRILDIDGTLQEAGGIVCSDGGNYRVGTGLPPGTTAYTEVRDVDYASGCGLLVRREAWQAVGGMDTAYFPAYHEDVDLCLALRAHGYRTVYAPDARLRHHQGASMDSDLREFAARRNGRYLAAKWADALTQYGPPPVGIELDAVIEDALARSTARSSAGSSKPPIEIDKRPAPPPTLEELQAQWTALQADVELKTAYLGKVFADIAALQAELSLLQSKVARLIALVRRVPFGHVVARRISRSVGAPKPRG